MKCNGHLWNFDRKQNINLIFGCFFINILFLINKQFHQNQKYNCRRVHKCLKVAISEKGLR